MILTVAIYAVLGIMIGAVINTFFGVNYNEVTSEIANTFVSLEICTIGTARETILITIGANIVSVSELSSWAGTTNVCVCIKELVGWTFGTFSCTCCITISTVSVTSYKCC